MKIKKTPKVAYLTIDDGPSRYFKEKVDYLLSKKIPAIFFCRGDFLEDRPKDAVYAIKSGFIISSHAYNHKHFSELPLAECFEQIKRTDEIVDSIYKQARVKRPIKVFRFPYGDRGRGDVNFLAKSKKVIALQSYLKKIGYRQPKFENIAYNWWNENRLSKAADVYWTYDCMEWALLPRVLAQHKWDIRNLQDVYKRMEKDKPDGELGLNFKDSNDIILVHDHKETHNLFTKIIERLLEKGIKFEKVKI